MFMKRTINDHGRILENLRRSADSARTAVTRATASATETMHSKKGKGKGAGKGKDGKGATKTFSGKNSKERGECVGKDCSKEKSPNGDLCGDCWTKAKADGGYTNQYGKRVNITANGKNKKPKAEANMAKGNNTSGPLAIEAAPSNLFIAASDYDQFAKFKQFMASGKVSS